MFESVPNHIKKTLSFSGGFYIEFRPSTSIRVGGFHIPTIQVLIWEWNDEHSCKYIRDALEYEV